MQYNLVYFLIQVYNLCIEIQRRQCFLNVPFSPYSSLVVITHMHIQEHNCLWFVYVVSFLGLYATFFLCVP